MRSKFIKEIVEEEFNIPDISKKNREPNTLYPRYVYYALCRKFSPESLNAIASTVGQDHATAIHALKRFEDYKGQEFFSTHYRGFKTICESMKEHVREIESKKEVEEFEAIREIQSKYNEKYMELLKKSHAIISSLKRRNKMLTSDIFQEIADLPEEDFNEFESLSKLFLKRKTQDQNHENN